jgi:hypothetical protein
VGAVNTPRRRSRAQNCVERRRIAMLHGRFDVERQLIAA